MGFASRLKPIFPALGPAGDKNKFYSEPQSQARPFYGLFGIP